MELQARVKARLVEHLSPTILEVSNESSMHNVPAGSETHLKVLVVSAAFAGRSSVERHRLVYDALGGEFRDGLHALSVTSRSPEEWASNSSIVESPACHGGSRR